MLFHVLREKQNSIFVNSAQNEKLKFVDMHYFLYF